MNLPLGYKYSALYAGIRKPAAAGQETTRSNDLGLIVSDAPASAAGVFTQNSVVAAPVKLSRKHLKKSGGVIKAILVNAGNANCATRTGDDVAFTCCQALARELEIDTVQVLPASTGVIGVELNPSLITENVPSLVADLSPERFEDVARAMLTTDRVMKIASKDVMLESGTVHIAGMTKGAGMIHPNMATTLGFILTDAALPHNELQTMLNEAVEVSYNRLSVDGDMSTNDTLLLMANGASGFAPRRKEQAVLQEAIAEVARSLAKQIARDGEGARKLISISVSGARDDEDAVRIARAIANSPLVKTAIAGCDANWGRILCAAGYSGAKFNERKVNIDLQGVRVCEAGLAAEFDEPALKQKLASPDCEIRFEIRGKNKGKAHFWTCDLTEKYIEINASYRT